jgi:hypothetical protein
VKITLEGASDEEFVVNMLDTEFFVDPINTGDTVRAHWKAADVHPLVGSNRRDRPDASELTSPQSCCCDAAREQEHPSPSAGRPIDAAPCQPASARATRPAKEANERSIRSRDSPLTMKTMRELWSSSGHSGK